MNGMTNIEIVRSTSDGEIFCSKTALAYSFSRTGGLVKKSLKFIFITQNCYFKRKYLIMGKDALSN